MAGEKREQANISFVEKYEQAKNEKPLLGKFTDGIKFKNIPPEGTITDINVSEQLREISAREKLIFLELCNKDVGLSETQADVLKEVLSNTIVGHGIKSYLPGEDLVAEHKTELLLIAATYINSLKE